MPSKETILIARHSPFNFLFLTEDAAGIRTLRFSRDGAFQSIVKVDDPEYLALPYTRVLPMCLAFLEKTPARILVVGLGGGTLPRLFHRILPEARIDAVEIDPEVAAIARDYCGLVTDTRMQVHIEDGRDFIEAREGLYDLIVLDSFGAESIPEHLLTVEFLETVRRALTKDGIAVANVWGRNYNPLYPHMLLSYREVFPEVYVLDVPGPGTKIFVALPAPLDLSREELSEKMDRIPLGHKFQRSATTFRNSDLERLETGSALRDRPVSPGRPASSAR